MLPRLPGIGAQVNGAFLAIELGPIKFQPAEFAKLGIIVFLASYLRETGDILVRPRLRPLPYQKQLLLYGLPAVLTLLAILVLDLGPAGSVLLIVFVASLVAVLRERPSPKHFGPLLLVWGLAMLMLIFIRDLGSSLMFFGGFLALLYVATGRLSLVGVGVTMFFGGAFFFAERVSHVRDRVRHLARHLLHRAGALPEHRGDHRVRQLPGLPGGPIAVRPGGRRVVRRGLRALAARGAQAATS